jgi:hypothetical protein
MFEILGCGLSVGFEWAISVEVMARLKEVMARLFVCG